MHTAFSGDNASFIIIRYDLTHKMFSQTNAFEICSTCFITGQRRLSKRNLTYKMLRKNVRYFGTFYRNIPYDRAEIVDRVNVRDAP